MKEYKRAIEDCNNALKINNQFARAYKRLFKCYISLGEIEVR